MVSPRPGVASDRASASTVAEGIAEGTAYAGSNQLAGRPMFGFSGSTPSAVRAQARRPANRRMLKL